MELPIELLRIYLNMEDAEAGVTEEEKRITKAFYGEE